MYILLNDKKVYTYDAVADPNALTLYVNNNLKMTELYDLFEVSNLENIKVYNDDDSLNAVYAGYVSIESFFFKPMENQYVINLKKYSTTDLKDGVDKCINKVDELSETVTMLTDGDLTIQSNYALMTIASTFSDEQAVKCVLLFEEWNSNGVSYKKDERIRYGNKLYKVLLDHVSQADWIPGAAPSLYVEVSDPSIEYPEWKQSTGAHDAYKKGDKVTYKGKKYISLIDANTYSPEAYPAGWQEVVE